MSWEMLPKGQAKARMIVCERVAERGGSLSDAAFEMDMLPSTLWHYLKRRGLGEIRERLGTPPNKRAKLPHKEAARRRELAKQVGVPLAAERLGLEYMTLYMWLRKNPEPCNVDS